MACFGKGDTFDYFHDRHQIIDKFGERLPNIWNMLMFRVFLRSALITITKLRGVTSRNWV